MIIRIRIIFSVLLALFAGVGLRVLALPPVVGDVDGVNFARALVTFDPLHQAPHLPGYPVLIALAAPLRALGFNDVGALALPGIAFFVPAALALFFGVRRHAGERAALLVVAFVSLLPGLVLTTSRPASDGLGLSLLTLAGGLALMDSSRSRVGAAVCFGLLLGVRLSWLPLVAFAIVALLWRADRRRVGLSFVIAVAAWGLPFAWLVGPGLVDATLAFGHGHLFAWGGTALSAEHATGARLLRASWGVWAAGFGGWWPGSVTPSTGAVVGGAVLIGLGGFLRARGAQLPRAVVVALLVTAGYAALAIVFQNVDKPRHLLPLVLALALPIGIGLARTRASVALACCALIACGLSSASRGLEQRTSATPAARMARYLAHERAPARLQVFAGEEARVLQHLSPAHRVWRVESPDVLAREIALAVERGADVLVSSGAPLRGLDSEVRLSPVARFVGRDVVFPHDAELTLYRARPSRLALGRTP
jgi:hypothetical protein